jgi:hypothetical protein
MLNTITETYRAILATLEIRVALGEITPEQAIEEAATAAAELLARLAQ